MRNTSRQASILCSKSTSVTHQKILNAKKRPKRLRNGYQPKVFSHWPSIKDQISVLLIRHLLKERDISLRSNWVQTDLQTPATGIESTLLSSRIIGTSLIVKKKTLPVLPSSIVTSFCWIQKLSKQ